MELRRVMICGGRGGCGKSTVAAGIACALSRRGLRVALVDFDLSERSLDMYLGCESRAVYDIGDLLSSRRQVLGVAVRPPEYDDLFLIPGAYHLRRLPTQEETERVLSAIENSLEADVLLLDTSSASDPSVRIGAALCDTALLVTVPGVLAVRSAASLADTLHEWGQDKPRLVVNRYCCDPRCPVTPDIRDIIDGTGLRLLGIVPENADFAHMQDCGIPAGADKASADVAAAFSNIAARLAGETVPLLLGVTRSRKKLLEI